MKATAEDLEPLFYKYESELQFKHTMRAVCIVFSILSVVSLLVSENTMVQVVMASIAAASLLMHIKCIVSGLITYRKIEKIEKSLDERVISEEQG